MPSGYAQTGWQHNADLQKEFERVSRAFSNIDKDIAEIAKAVEPIKKESKKGLTVLHNEELIQEAKKVEILNFLDSENVTYEINSERSNDKSKVENSNATKVNITPRAIIDTCMNEMLGYINLMMNRQLIPLPDTTTPYQPPYRAIKCDNPGNHSTGYTAKDTAASIQSILFVALPSPPPEGSIMYKASPYRVIKYFNECFNLGMNSFDNTAGYTKIIIRETGLYKVSAVFTGQYEEPAGNDVEVHTGTAPATIDGDTVAELFIVINGVYNSLLNGQRIANKSIHLQGEDLVFLNVNDEVSIGFKAFEYTSTNQREINLIWGAPTAPLTPLYSHFTIERLASDVQSQSNEINTYTGVYL
jgi:hypothetical protein